MEKDFYVNVKDEKNTKRVLELWLRKSCEKIINEKVEKYKDRFNISPKEIKVKGTKN